MRPQLPTPLSRRETEVLACMADGLSNPDIGRRLFLAEETVRTHAQKINRKLGTTTRTGAVIAGMRAGLIPCACGGGA